MLPKDYQWVSKAQTGRDLLTLLVNSKDMSESYLRRSLANTLALFVTEDVAAEIEAIINDASEDTWTRVYLLRGLAVAQWPVHTDTLERLLMGWLERFQRPQENCHFLKLDTSDDLYRPERIRALVVDEWTKTVVLGFLKSRPDSIKFEFLRANSGYYLNPEARYALEFCNELLGMVLSSTISDSEKRMLAQGMSHQCPAARLWMIEALTAPNPDRATLECLPYVEDFEEYRAFAEEQPELVQSLLAAAKIQGIDTDTDRTERFEEPFPAGRLEAALEELCRAHAVFQQPRRSRFGNHRSEIPVYRALNALQDRREGLLAILPLLENGQIDSAFWHVLEGSLHEHDPQLARDWLLQVQPRSSRLGYTCFVRLSTAPKADLELLQFGLTLPHPCFRYLALHMLDIHQIELTDSQIQALKCDPEVFVRLRLHGLLWRRGQLLSEELLLSYVSLGQPPQVRAEALRWLAAVDPTRHVELFEWCLFHDHEWGPCQYHPPVAEEAAYGLAVIGTERALATLTRASIEVRNNALDMSFETYIKELLKRLEGRLEAEPLEPDDRPELPAPRNCPEPKASTSLNIWRSALPHYPPFKRHWSRGCVV